MYDFCSVVLREVQSPCRPGYLGQQYRADTIISPISYLFQVSAIFYALPCEFHLDTGTTVSQYLNCTYILKEPA